MGLSRRKQEQIGAEVRASLADFAAAVEVRLHAELDRSVRTQLALAKAVKGLRDDIVDHNGELARALERLCRAIEAEAEAATADRLERRALSEVEWAERKALVEADRTERRAMIEAIAYLADTLTDHDRVVPVAHDIDLALERELTAPRPDIDLVAEARAYGRPRESANGNGTNAAAHRSSRGNDVQCYIEGQWIGGFEVCDVIGSSENRRYRVRRQPDGSVLRRLLEGHEVRFDRAERDTSGAPRRGTWFGA